MMKEEGKIFESGTILFSGFIFAKVLSYLSLIIISSLGVVNYGIYSLTLSITLFLISFGVLGLGQTLIVFLPKFTTLNRLDDAKGMITDSITISLITGIILSISLFITSPIISQIFTGSQVLTPYLRIAALIIPVDILSRVLGGAFLGLENPKDVFKYQQIINGIGKLSAYILVVTIGYGVGGILFSYFIIGFIILIFYFKRLKKCFNVLQDHSVKSSHDIRRLLTFSLTLIPFLMIYQLIDVTNNSMVTVYLSLHDVGLFNLGHSIAFILVSFSFSFSWGLLPRISNKLALRKDPSTIIQNTNNIVLLFSAIILLALVLFPMEIISIPFGASFLGTWVILPTIGLAYVFGSLFNIHSTILQAYNKTKNLMAYSILAVVFNALLNYYLTPALGIRGAALSTMIALFSAFIISFIHSCILIDKKTFNRNSINILGLTLLFLFSGFVLKSAVPAWMVYFLMILIPATFAIITVPQTSIKESMSSLIFFRSNK